jgi:hypothetical protein
MRTAALPKTLVAVLFIFLAWTLGPPVPSSQAADRVSIENMGAYFKVTIDLSGGATLATAAQEYLDKLLIAVPNFEALGDSYLVDSLAEDPIEDFVPVNILYQLALSRVNDFKAQLPEEYRNAIQSIGEKLSGGTTNVLGDGKLSVDEAFLLNLVADVLRGTQCSSLSVWGGRSATGNTISTRNLEWYPGGSNQLAQLHAVTTIKDGEKSVAMVGFLGIFAPLSAINDEGVFAAILDSPSGAMYSSAGKRSYPFDLLYALREYKTIEDIAAYMSDPAKSYAYNHNILLSDPNRAMVLENNFSGSGDNMRRALRAWDSELQDGITWGFDNALCVVNSFLLKGNHQNQYLPGQGNETRWETYKALLGNSATPVDAARMQVIASNFQGAQPGDSSDIYEDTELHIIVVQPAAMTWDIFFRPKDGVLPAQPVFETIPISFQ